MCVRECIRFNFHILGSRIIHIGWYSMDDMEITTATPNICILYVHFVFDAELLFSEWSRSTRWSGMNVWTWI